MIKSVRVENFQSHKSTNLKFNSGVNVIYGLSDSGKSAFVRALGSLLQRDTFYLRHGEESGLIASEFDDIIFQRCFKKSSVSKCSNCKEKIEESDQVCPNCGELISIKSGSDVFHLTGYDKPIEKFGAKIPQFIFDKTRIFPISFVDFEVFLQMASQHDDMFFIGKSFSGPARNKIISTLIPDSEKIDALIKEFRSEILSKNTAIKIHEESLKNAIDRIEIAQKDIEDIREEFKRIEDEQESIKGLEEQRKSLVEISHRLRRGGKILQAQGTVEYLGKKTIPAMDGYVSKIEALENRMQKLVSLNKSLKGTKNLAELKIESFEEFDLEDIERDSKKLNTLKRINTSLNITKKNEIEAEDEIKKIEKEMKDLEKEFSDFLETEAICPITKEKYCDSCLERLKDDTMGK
jgi:chromosome segregation ATPase